MKKAWIVLVVLSVACVLPAEERKDSGWVQKKPIPLEVKWFRNSAEQKALFREIYHVATRYVEGKVRSEALKPGTWGIVMDIDETVLDNSWYQKIYTEPSDDEDPFSRIAVRPEKSTALPGAIEFTRKVHELGGYVSLVSNRDGSYTFEKGGVLESTVNNLRREGISFDQAVLANRKGSKNPTDKNPRFKAIETGNYDPSQMIWTNKLPPHQVIAWFGDNIQDFPALRQRSLVDVSGSNEAFAPFGNGYFILPNPMYGSWEANEYK